jgi:hypothetical protein
MSLILKYEGTLKPLFHEDEMSLARSHKLIDLLSFVP